MAIELVKVYREKNKDLASLAHMLMGSLAAPVLAAATANDKINTSDFIAYTLASQHTEQVKAQIKALSSPAT